MPNTIVKPIKLSILVLLAKQEVTAMNCRLLMMKFVFHHCFWHSEEPFAEISWPVLQIGGSGVRRSAVFIDSRFKRIYIYFW